MVVSASSSDSRCQIENKSAVNPPTASPTVPEAPNTARGDGKSRRSRKPQGVRHCITVIPSWESLTDDERACVDQEGQPWPVRVFDHLPEVTSGQQALINFLVDAGVSRWAR